MSDIFVWLYMWILLCICNFDNCMICYLSVPTGHINTHTHRFCTTYRNFTISKVNSNEGKKKKRILHKNKSYSHFFLFVCVNIYLLSFYFVWLSYDYKKFLNPIISIIQARHSSWMKMKNENTKLLLFKSFMLK